MIDKSGVDPHGRTASLRGGGDDCVACVKEDPGDEPIRIHQIIETLAYHKETKTADIRLLFVVHNPNPKPTGFRIVHPGDVAAELARFPVEGGDKKLEVLRGLYAGRIRFNKQDPDRVNFFRRVNCLSAAEQPDSTSLAGPGGVLNSAESRIPLPRESQACSGQAYSSFLIPPIAPNECALFLVDLSMPPSTYSYLIDERSYFSVASYTRILRTIRAMDFGPASAPARDWFDTVIAPERCHLVPAAYDIVIFQGSLGDPVAVHSESMFIMRVHPTDEQLANQVLWFFGKPADEFYLELSLPSHPDVVSAERTRKGFPIDCETQR